MDLLYRHITVFKLFSLVLDATTALPDENIFFTNANGAYIADYISSKNYVPKEKYLQRTPLIKNFDNDATYLLSRLSDEELLKLLNYQPERKEFSLNDIVKIALNVKTDQENIFPPQEGSMALKPVASNKNKRYKFINGKGDKVPAYFRLNHKLVDKQNDINYNALQKLQNLLNMYQESKIDEIDNGSNDEKKELLFDILIAQLKSLCCKKNKKTSTNNVQYSELAHKILPSLLENRINFPNKQSMNMMSNEYIFLIMNDDIKSDGSEDLLTVDPESLDGNSSVLLLGPVTTPLSDDQLKLVMKRISNELIKPEYLSLLQQLSDKAFIGNNRNLKNVLIGPETRRYIKPHRCNHQSKLARVYGGPKWIICTGYLNLNKPSLYD